MSWDISIQDLPTGIQSLEELPASFRPALLGHRSVLIARIQEIFPEIDFSDPAWGTLALPESIIEFNMGSAVVCEGFMLHVRGGGNPVPTVARLLQHLRLRAIDCQTGNLFSPEAAEASFSEWQQSRDRTAQPEET